MNEQEEKHPLEFSLKGNNTIYVGCEFRAFRQNYAICLNVIKAYEEGRRKLEEECCSEIKRGVCPALAMRKEEVEAGYALHYKPRAPAPEVKKEEKVIFQSSNYTQKDPNYQRGWNHAGSVINGAKNKSIKSVPIAPLAQNKRFTADVEARVKSDNLSFSDAISSAIKSEIGDTKNQQKQKELVEKEIKETPIKQESLLEKARRLREQKEMSR